MTRLLFFNRFIAVCLLFCIAVFPFSGIEALASASDRLSLSWPGTPSNHTITFRTIDNLPASSRIRITPEVGQFFIPPFFDYSDVDFSTSDALNGIYSDRNLASSSAPGIDNVIVLASSSNGTIDIVLSPDMGISAGTYLKIELGTNADFGEIGDSRIINPIAVDSYTLHIQTYDNNNTYLEQAKVMVAIVEPVRMGNVVLKNRSNGTPDGVLTYGTTQSILSLMTNYAADCRWSDTASTSYYAMTEVFEYTGAFYHSSIITGITTGTYNYYVRCLDTEGEVDTTDYLISFSIAGFEGQGGDQDVEGTPGTGGGAGPGTGSGSGGGTGSTAGTGAGTALPFPPLPGDPIVSFQGYAYPSSKVILLQDGNEIKTLTAEASGSFDIDIMELPQGVYTFSILGEDKLGRKPAARSFTFYVKEGTKTQLYNVFLSPTIDVPVPSFDIGDDLNVFGQSAANADIELQLFPKVVGGVSEAEILKFTGKSGNNGEWNFSLDTSKLVNGPYQVKAKASLPTSGSSEFSKIIELMVGGELPKVSACAGADLNGDGKVNITDFSILLYWWNKDDDCADQNDDGVVNLIDFSIMMFNWTG